jgi:hemin uptake protein HemP
LRAAARALFVIRPIDPSAGVLPGSRHYFVDLQMRIVIIYRMSYTKSPEDGDATTPGQGASQAPSTPADHAAAGPRRIQSSELFAGQTELTIVHAREHYRLRITRNDKLILTK